MKISLIVASLVLACFSAQAAPALVSEDKRVDSLIILFAAGVPSAPIPADVIESVTRITKGESVDDKTDALFIRVGAPLSARWLVEHRLTPAQTAIFEDGNKDSPDCWRSRGMDQPCSLRIDQGRKPAVEAASMV